MDLEPEIAKALAALDAQLRPIEPQQLALALFRTLKLWPLPPNWDDVAEFYLEALADVPTDLVDAALKRVRFSFRYESFPKPADFRCAIEAALAERRQMARRLRVSEAMARRRFPDRQPSPAPTADQVARVTDLAQRTVTRLRAKQGGFVRAEDVKKAPSRESIAVVVDRVAADLVGFRLPEMTPDQVEAELRAWVSVTPPGERE